MLRVSFVTDPATLRRGKDAEVKKQCSFCLRELANLERLVTASDVSICSDCVRRCVDELEVHRVRGWRRWWDLRPRRRVPAESAAGPYRTDDVCCSFCRKKNDEELIVADYARICSPCVRLAADVFREDRERPR